LNADGGSVLRDHRLLQDAERILAGTGWVETGLVFTQSDGTALHPADVTDRFQEIIAEIGLPPVRLHDLRHAAATLALAGGAEMKVVQNLLGHANINFTADTYTSVLPELHRIAAENAAALIPRAHRRDRHAA
jgi:site-specific recombinase XerD